ncbi:ABC transporter permease [Saccharolobus islandicus]|uniref:ABC-type dipeptide/oligopeptide/nickel transport system, permease, DppC n=1 Tax=Saccharolobus islandicus (strain REY15A) TaxID=930945 RepID=F0ND38_SACI5|nr:ABC transporter permease [Sulfolobus islandicus]ADX86335.1 ABC-type dipeptide/oligopeptide/nickel transport system, permease, DppC [Sulfolobus islandicus REY15A]
MNLKDITKNMNLTVGLIIILSFLILTIISTADLHILTPYNPNQLNFSQANLPPSSNHVFGTDQEGRDVFTRSLTALRIDFSIPFLIVGISMLIGTIIGILSGYFGGLLDEALMRITDIFLAFPGILLALAISEILGSTHLSLRLYLSALALAIVNWPIYARLVRAQILQVKNMQYITLAKVAGLNNFQIIKKHIIPHLVSLLLVYTTLDMGTIILNYSILAFFGLGAPPPTPELGRMVYDGLSALPQNWWSSIFPAIIITLMALGYSLAGDGLRDILDPRLGERTNV